MDFTGFLGNDAVKARLSGAFASGRVAHSYLICGPVGSGKHTLTRILCAAMQCEGRGEKIPCGVCSGCRKALEGVHPDIITVDDPEHKSMTVEPIRAARSDMFIRPRNLGFLLVEALRLLQWLLQRQQRPIRLCIQHHPVAGAEGNGISCLSALQQLGFGGY